MSSSQQLSAATEDAKNILITMIRLYCIQTKQLQEMQIFLSGDQTLSSFNNNANSSPPPQPIMPISMPNIVTRNNAGVTTTTLATSNASILHQLFPVNQSLHKSLSLDTSRTTDSEQRQATPSLKHSRGVPPGFEVEDSAIIHVNTTQISAPILMTPDAFLNSPNSSRATLTSAANLPELKSGADFLQSFIKTAAAGNTVAAAAAPGSSSVGVSQSLNLNSSRASSLTQVTAVTNNIAPSSKTSAPSKRVKQRARASSTSSSSSSSTSNSSYDSDLDLADKEIASLSAKAKAGRSKQHANEYKLLKKVIYNSIIIICRVGICFTF